MSIVVKNPFDHQKPSEEQCARIEMMRTAFKNCWAIVESACEDSRYKSLSKTAMEESCQWAVKSIVFE